MSLEPVDSKDRGGWAVAGGEDCLQVMEVEIPVGPDVSSVLPALGRVEPVCGSQCQFLAVEGQGGMPRIASMPAVGVDLMEWARDIKGCLCTESRLLAWCFLIL